MTKITFIEEKENIMCAAVTKTAMDQQIITVIRAEMSP